MSSLVVMQWREGSVMRKRLRGALYIKSHSLDHTWRLRNLRFSQLTIYFDTRGSHHQDKRFSEPASVKPTLYSVHISPNSHRPAGALIVPSFEIQRSLPLSSVLSRQHRSLYHTSQVHYLTPHKNGSCRSERLETRS